MHWLIDSEFFFSSTPSTTYWEIICLSTPFIFFWDFSLNFLKFGIFDKAWKLFLYN